jgi:uncharacterized damage-inducible protein DinB
VSGEPEASSEAQRIADLIDRVVSGDPWHGDSVVRPLDGVTAADAARHPVLGAHSIWQLVLHMTGWAEEVRARLEGAEAGEPSAGDWPETPEARDAAWTAAKARLIQAHAGLAATLRALSDDALHAAVRDRRDRAAGTGLSKYLTAHGLAHHTAYHAGQIALLRRALDG